MTVTTALYRRYRPDSFADVIGQEHVTGPLMTALRKNRVNHAYLFSGPRGCGKTTSARILARCLNCAEGPTDTPCGVCPSCVELARGGSGSLDVIEIDAASHGGVDDARDLRERATYAPVRDRYKIFIIDEAHMVTSAGFNALLKIVEEPPEHIKFIFATTEPDKVIGTIRSRTHHYPFRLVPPEPLMAYLELLCNQENVPVAPGVLSLVIRAGGGSVRDSLSVLDQLMAGAGPNGLDYELAVALLGYTHASLLDDVVEAVAASDAATVFRAVDRVIQTGHDPRRFVEDLLERFRDLIIVQAMPESAQVILRGMPADQIARLQNQAHNLGAAELSRAADVTNTALTEMTGATSPRLHLELLCARILLPSSEQNERGIAARIDRVERRLNYSGHDAGAPAGQGASGTLGAGSAPHTPAAAAIPVAAQAAPAAGGQASEPHAPAAQSPSAQDAAGQAASVQAPAEQAPAGQAQVPQAASAPAPADGPQGQTPRAPLASAQPQAGPDAPSRPATGESSPRTAHGAPGAGTASTTDGRPPLTAPRVSTNDWPVDQPGNERHPGGITSPVQPGAGQPAPESGPAAAATGPQPASEQAQPASSPTRHATAPAGSDQASHGRGDVTPAPGTASSAGQDAPRVTAAPGGPAGMGDVEVLRRAWPDVLQTLSKIKRSTWALVEPNAQVSAFDGSVLTLAFATSGLAGAFGRADHSENLRQAIHKTVGIDCQINAVAAGAGQASAEPNPKAPASQVATAKQVPTASPAATASSADVAWGLAPAPAAVPEPADAGGRPVHNAASSQPTRTGSSAVPAGTGAAQAAERAEASMPPAPRDQAQGARADVLAPGRAPGNPGADGTPGADGNPGRPAPSGAGTPGSAQAPTAANRPAGSAAPSGTSAAAGGDPYAALAGDYSYSDDDWGPPRDEDAPPLEEEPPMDWAPSPAKGRKPAAVPAAASAQTPGSASAPASSPAPAASAVGETPQRPSGTADGAHDPWTRAVEQAPGVWVVGTESNVGAAPAAGGASTEVDNPSRPAGVTPVASTPHYEPATAQAPPSIPVTPSAGPARTAVAASAPVAATPPAAAPAAAASPAAASPEPQQAREYAMASSAPASAAPSPAPATATAPAPAAATRQSLYQRLSNSPEAEAGRAKAPARAAAAAATYVQDIPSADDETIEESGVFGRAAVERILGGKLIEERSPDGSPIAPRY
ncbi:DNA polymerase III, subunits gamma and tau [Pseudarthrobacter chlorophenolicus A6]|uniref:DNA polymerase III subunit gamma/tau n=1 Tax=Pseudarthrobacter chlorophenolicus (strain ATCC 700700 / DSM 12829 / CIP 107037 / JCM 12360 / KCTC 9906 / NCIMB 13794 / A6) TaxID=452863 RepID=B8HBY1_PSECP|nr:DNA polymerase III subunit gamma and tau [Pseudarthrobacter chlorophenolicus]ACL38691.1 DNA polymerase III, subunits gamma and tau [Pseudarthrobacter chlorophenolicus A6]